VYVVHELGQVSLRAPSDPSDVAYRSRAGVLVKLPGRSWNRWRWLLRRSTTAVWDVYGILASQRPPLHSSWHSRGAHFQYNSYGLVLEFHSEEVADKGGKNCSKEDFAHKATAGDRPDFAEDCIRVRWFVRKALADTPCSLVDLNQALTFAVGWNAASLDQEGSTGSKA